jgi:hypothetical protein
MANACSPVTTRLPDVKFFRIARKRGPVATPAQSSQARNAAVGRCGPAARRSGHRDWRSSRWPGRLVPAPAPPPTGSREDLDQYSARADQLIVGDRNVDDRSGHLRADGDVAGIHEGVIRRLVVPGMEPPGDHARHRHKRRDRQCGYRPRMLAQPILLSPGRPLLGFSADLRCRFQRERLAIVLDRSFRHKRLALSTGLPQMS